MVKGFACSLLDTVPVYNLCNVHWKSSGKLNTENYYYTGCMCVWQSNP